MPVSDLLCGPSNNVFRAPGLTISGTLGSSVIAPKEQTVEDTLNGQIRELNRRIHELVEMKGNLSPAVLASPVSVIREAAKHL